MRSPARHRWAVGLGALAASLVALIGLVAWLNVRGEAPLDTAPPPRASPALIERGAYLARAGNCAGCHSVLDGAAFAGGRGIETPFGIVYSSNLTPDPATGIGTWSSGEFWRAMHHGRSRNGRLLYPAFPYPSFTHLTREDSDALYAFLRSVQPVAQPNHDHALRFPYSTQAALAAWRAMFFRPGEFASVPAESAEWNRGKYLVQALGHCAACHSGRNALGGTRLNAEFAGGLMPDESWYAPSLASPHEAGLQAWKHSDIVALLKSGIAGDSTVSGPMAEVVFNSTQYLSEPDLAAMAGYLAAIPVRASDRSAFEPGTPGAMKRGEKLYASHCAACHGGNGQGVKGIYPALAGNRAITLDSPANIVQVIRLGGFSPSTAGNPQPFGMPPFGQTLDNEDIAAVSTFIRQSWGNRASELTAVDVMHIN